MVLETEYTEGYYEVQNVEFGKVCRWYPGCVVVECDCGERLSLTDSMATCSCCEAYYAATVRGELAGKQLREEALHPWRY
jgi:hypothetical protein